MEIENTILQIIADANRFRNIHDNLYIDKENNKFVATQYGFIPDEIYNTELLIRQHKIETEKLTSEINKLNNKLDDADYDLIVARKEVTKLQEKLKNTKQEDKQVAYNKGEIKHLKETRQALKDKNDRLKKSNLEYQEVLFQFLSGENYIKAMNKMREFEAEQIIELFSGELTQEVFDKTKEETRVNPDYEKFYA